MFDRLQNLTATHFFLLGALLGGMIHFSKMSDHADIEIKQQELKSSIAAKNDELKMGQSLAEEKDKYQEEIEKINVLMKTVKEIIPPLHSQVEIMAVLSQEAKRTGVRVAVLKPASVAGPRGQYYQSVSYELELDGTFTQVTNYFDNLTKIKNLIHIKNLFFARKEKSNGASIINTRATVFAFRYVDSTEGTEPPQ